MQKELDKVMPLNQIRLKAMAVFSKNGKTLAYKGFDPEKQETFYRLLGGTVEFGETGKQAIHREILEELGSEISNVKQVDVVENIFEYKGRAGHQVTFLFTADLVNEDLYNQDQIQIVEQDYDAPMAEWISCQDVLENKVILYPKFDYQKYLK